MFGVELSTSRVTRLQLGDSSFVILKHFTSLLPKSPNLGAEFLLPDPELPLPGAEAPNLLLQGAKAEFMTFESALQPAHALLQIADAVPNKGEPFAEGFEVTLDGFKDHLNAIGVHLLPLQSARCLGACSGLPN